MEKIKRKVSKAACQLMNNPKLFFQKAYARIRSVYPFSKYPLRKKMDGVLFEFDFAYDSAIRMMYCGIYEKETVEVMKRFLSKGDTFIDIGANIGYLSAIALGLVGKAGEVHSFEPVPRYFIRLKKMALLNKEYRIKINQYALGNTLAVKPLAVTNVANIGWNTMVPGFMSKETVKETIEIPVLRLDDYIKEKALEGISLVKIDTEGFEFPVLKGLSGYFESTQHRPVIICEVVPAAYPLLGYSLQQLTEYMKNYNYEAVDASDVNMKRDITKLETSTNVIFMPTNNG